MLNSLAHWLRSRYASRPNRATARKKKLSCKLNVLQLEDRVVPSTIQGALFEDLNGDGNIAADPNLPLAGVTMYLDQNQNGLRDVGETSTTTDSGGAYSFAGLPNGTYYVRQEVPAGMRQTSPNAPPMGELLLDFATPENGTTPGGKHNYSGAAWVNGSLFVTHVRESGPDNVMYEVNPLTGAVIGSPISIPEQVGEITYDGANFWGADYSNELIIKFNASGQELQRLSFPGMDINSVEWNGSHLWVLDQDARRIYQIDPTGSGSILGFINTPNENVGGLTFDGHNLWINGRDSDQFYALNPATGTVQHSFAFITDFPYGLAFDGDSLWQCDNRNSRIWKFSIGRQGEQVVTLSGADVTGIDFGNFSGTTISGKVFHDNNQNGAREAAEPGLAGWRVFVDGNNNGQYDRWERSTVTNSLGDYSFAEMRAGTHTIREDFTAALRALPHWSQTGPVGSKHLVTIANSGEVVTGKDFGNYLDRVDPLLTDWAHGTGNWPPYLSMYTGLMFYHDEAAASYVDWNSAQTVVANSVYGGYSDWRLPSLAEAQAAARDFHLGNAADNGRLQAPNFGFWTSTAQGNRAYRVFLGDPNAQTVLSLKAGNSWVAGIRDSATIIDDGSAGYVDNNWTAKTGGYLGDYRQTNAGNGSKTATWTFSGLEAGATYKVVVTWKNASANASNAPFTVFDNTTALATVAVNQKVAPNDFQVDTTFWEGIGSYTISSGTLKVQLSNNANGTVVADAVRVFRVYPSFAPAAPLMAAGGEVTDNPNSEILTNEQLQPVLAEALRRWEIKGVDVSAFTNLTVNIVNLGGATLGLAAGNTIWLDDNAAGWGWFVDPTPWDDSEFTTAGDQGEQNRIDLLSVLAHELGHLLGLDHDEAGVMNDTLATGSRETPAASWTKADSALVDLAFAGEDHPLRRKRF